MTVVLSGWFYLLCCWEMNHWNMENSQWEADYVWCSPTLWRKLSFLTFNVALLNKPWPTLLSVGSLVQNEGNVQCKWIFCKRLWTSSDHILQPGCLASLRYVDDTFAVRSHSSCHRLWESHQLPEIQCTMVREASTTRLFLNVWFAKKGPTLSTKGYRKLTHSWTLNRTTNLLQKRSCS